MRPTPFPPSDSPRPSYRSIPCTAYTAWARPVQSNGKGRPCTSIRDLPRNPTAACASACCLKVPAPFSQQDYPCTRFMRAEPSRIPSDLVSGRGPFARLSIAQPSSQTARRPARRRSSNMEEGAGEAIMGRRAPARRIHERFCYLGPLQQKSNGHPDSLLGTGHPLLQECNGCPPRLQWAPGLSAGALARLATRLPGTRCSFIATGGTRRTVMNYAG